MSFSDSDLKKLFVTAMTAAARAGAHIESEVGEYREVQSKQGGGNTLASQVVTEVDLESQRLIMESLSASVADYGLGVLTEESEDDASRHRAEAFWCVDPLDGTLPFVEGTPGYSVSIALVSRQGQPLIGVVRDPSKDQTFHALKGRGAFLNGEPLAVDRASPNEGKLTWIMDRSMKGLNNYPEITRAMNELAVQFGCGDGLSLIDHAGAALNGCWVTQHAPAVYFKLPKPERGGGSLWDFAASACVLQELGIAATDIFGEALDLNPEASTFMNERGVLYASSVELRLAVLRMLASVR